MMPSTKTSAVVTQSRADTVAAERLIREARVLQRKLTGLLETPVSETSPLDQVPSDVVELIRRARDLCAVLA